MSVQLLDKTRKINQLLHNNNTSKVVFNDICDVLTGILNSNILVISRKGKVLGVGLCDGVDEIGELIVDKVGGFIDPLLNDRLLGVLSTKENVNLETLGFEGENVRKYQAIINPIDIAGERLGTVFMYKYGSQYEIDDIILSEYGTTVVGLEMMRSYTRFPVDRFLFDVFPHSPPSRIHALSGASTPRLPPARLPLGLQNSAAKFPGVCDKFRECCKTIPSKMTRCSSLLFLLSYFESLLYFHFQKS